MEKHKFHESLKNGKRGEEIFLSMYETILERLDGFQSDFKLIKSGKTIELKTDFYNPKETENFFLERWSRNAVAGGPWQALEKGSFYYIYFFVSTKDIYVFETAELVKKLETIVSDYRLIPVKNVGFTTMGYKMPRELFEDIRKHDVLCHD